MSAPRPGSGGTEEEGWQPAAVSPSKVLRERSADLAEEVEDAIVEGVDPFEVRKHSRVQKDFGRDVGELLG